MPSCGVAIGKLRRSRVGVNDPDQPAVGDHQVRIRVKRQERSDQFDAVLDIAIEQERRAVLDIAGDEDIAILQRKRADELGHDVVEANAADDLILGQRCGLVDLR